MNYDSTICLAKRNDDIFPQKTCTGMLITTLFIIEKMESMYSSTCEWYWYIYMWEHYFIIEINCGYKKSRLTSK